MNKLRCFIWLMITILWCGYSCAALKVSITTRYGSSQIRVGDTFYLTVKSDGEDFNFSRPELPGAKLVYMDGPIQFDESTNINGRRSHDSGIKYVASFKALKEGNYTYGPITIGRMKSNAARYTIVGGNTATPPQSQGGNMSPNAGNTQSSAPKFIGKGDENIFLKASVSKTTAYEQEALLYTVKLYCTYSAVKFIGATSAPKFDGFVVEESNDISNHLTFETYQGKSYATAVIARYVIFPQMTGNLKVKGNTYTISVDSRSYYHDPTFGNLSFSTPVQLNVTPNDLVVNARPLPSPKPADFSGGVGEFSISSKLKTSDFKTNQAGAIIYTIQGSGNIKYIQMPELSSLYPTEIEVYSPTTTQNVKVNGSTVAGSVQFDYSFMPLEQGSYEIPDIKLVYFNPETGKYETSVAKGYSINVGKGNASLSSPAHTVKFIPDLENVNTKALTKEKKLWTDGFLFWLWFIIPSILLIGAIVARKSYTNMRADMDAFYSRKASKIANARLKIAAKELKRGNKDKFYDELLKAMWGYAGYKLKMPTSELMRDNIRQMMLEHDVPQNYIDTFIEIIDNSEFAKYSSSNQAQDMQEAYNQAKMNINALEKAFKNSQNNPANNPIKND